VRDALNKVLDPLGGMSAFVKKGDRVLLKPNLLAPMSPGTAVCTHPQIVRATALEVIRAGGVPLIGDSPAVGSLAAVLKKSGIFQVVQELGIETVPFRTPVTMPVPEGGVFKSLKLAAEAAEADLIINLPKIKTHGMMTITLAVKNMFGMVVGAAKPGWHFQAREHLRFADMLLDINRTLPPALSVMDGVAAMEGRGPSSGDQVALHLVLASSSTVALDLVAGRIVGVPLEKHPVLYQARARGLRGALESEVRVSGEAVDDVRMAFKLPASASRIDFKLPDGMRDFMRKSLHSFPQLDPGKCTSCGQCADICPTGAISLNGRPENGGNVDRDLCISCFCCLEVCPEKAVDIVPGRLLRVLRKVNLA
jgi:uncharacterized protein (DUF362 family)/Pyruvate/2-oxoacid:ferredoxin oxidoreductase delta subunit